MSTMPMRRADEVAKLVEPHLDDLSGAREARFLQRTEAKDRRSGSLVVRPSDSEGNIVHSNCQETSPLLGLPAELRDRIYEYTVFEPHAIDTYSRRVKIQKKSKKERKGEKIKKGEKRPRGQEPVVFPHMESTPPLAATSRQLRNEVLPVYFSSNTFAFRYDLHYVSSNIRIRQILSFKYRTGLDIRWIRKVKCALVSIISPKPSPDHMYCESTVTAERKRFGCRIMITVQQSHTYHRSTADLSVEEVKEVSEGCKCSLQTTMDGIAKSTSGSDDTILEIGRICGGYPFGRAKLERCPSCGLKNIVPER